MDETRLNLPPVELKSTQQSGHDEFDHSGYRMMELIPSPGAQHVIMICLVKNLGKKDWPMRLGPIDVTEQSIEARLGSSEVLRAPL